MIPVFLCFSLRHRFLAIMLCICCRYPKWLGRSMGVDNNTEETSQPVIAKERHKLFSPSDVDLTPPFALISHHYLIPKVLDR